MTLIIDTETDTRTQTEINTRRDRIAALRAILSAFEDHQLVKLPFDLTDLALQAHDVEHLSDLVTMLTDHRFVIGPIEASPTTANRPILYNDVRVGKIYGNPSIFLPSSAATVGLIGAVFGTSAPWADEAPEDDDDYEPEPDDADELYRDDDPLAYVTTVDPLVRS